MQPTSAASAIAADLHATLTGCSNSYTIQGSAIPANACTTPKMGAAIMYIVDGRMREDWLDNCGMPKHVVQELKSASREKRAVDPMVIDMLLRLHEPLVTDMAHADQPLCNCACT